MNLRLRFCHIRVIVKAETISGIMQENQWFPWNHRQHENIKVLEPPIAKIEHQSFSYRLWYSWNLLFFCVFSEFVSALAIILAAHRNTILIYPNKLSKCNLLLILCCCLNTKTLFIHLLVSFIYHFYKIICWKSPNFHCHNFPSKSTIVIWAFEKLRL